ncbi:hypothetical protein BBEV_0097 [Salisediminibacterium beveridgei]|uniref:Uncharacterized protein n=1 Tax=Salisediminibacterium beveridgei TaxID=632773 RepID=A0A1D7QR45_9BACI|nr:hypothetical protein BBEV_0097 [Salisediminibacterium beveridgei]
MVIGSIGFITGDSFLVSPRIQDSGSFINRQDFLSRLRKQKSTKYALLS